MYLCTADSSEWSGMLERGHLRFGGISGMRSGLAVLFGVQLARTA